MLGPKGTERVHMTSATEHGINHTRIPATLCINLIRTPFLNKNRNFIVKGTTEGNPMGLFSACLGSPTRMSHAALHE
jgi:hypothetical protein